MTNEALHRLGQGTPSAICHPRDFHLATLALLASISRFCVPNAFVAHSECPSIGPGSEGIKLGRGGSAVARRASSTCLLLLVRSFVRWSLCVCSLLPSFAMSDNFDKWAPPSLPPSLPPFQPHSGSPARKTPMRYLKGMPPPPSFLP